MLPTLRGCLTLGSRVCISRITRRNRVLDTMDVNVLSTRTGSSWHLPDVPQARAPV